MQDSLQWLPGDSVVALMVASLKLKLCDRDKREVSSLTKITATAKVYIITKVAI